MATFWSFLRLKTQIVYSTLSSASCQASSPLNLRSGQSWTVEFQFRNVNFQFWLWQFDDFTQQVFSLPATFSSIRSSNTSWTSSIDSGTSLKASFMSNIAGRVYSSFLTTCFPLWTWCDFLFFFLCFDDFPAAYGRPCFQNNRLGTKGRVWHILGILGENWKVEKNFGQFWKIRILALKRVWF